MDERTRRRVLGSIATAGVVGAAGCVGGGMGGDGTGGTGDSAGSATSGDGGGDSGGDGSDGGGDAPTWRTAELTDVTTGETFTVADLSKPVLLETFAVWCSKCERQQRIIRNNYDRIAAAATVVALNIDPNEDAGKVRSHAESSGYEWRYVVSPPPVTDSLVEQFGSSMTVAPRVPKVLVCESGARRLPNGIKSADTLRSQIADGC